MGLYPPSWGPKFWPIIHLLAFRYKMSPPHNQEAIHQFFENLCFLLPCEHCENHCGAYMKQYPPDYSGDLFKWTVDFHNFVNKNKGMREYTLDEAKQDIINSYYNYNNLMEIKNEFESRVIDKSKLPQQYQPLKDDVETSKTSDDSTSWYIVAAIVVGLLLCLMLIYFLIG